MLEHNVMMSTMLKFRYLIRYFSSSAKPSVAILWDLQTRPPNSTSPFEDVARLKMATFSFGIVRHMISYAHRGLCDSVSHVVGKIRKKEEQVCLERRLTFLVSAGGGFTPKRSLCINLGCMREIELASGTRRVNLVGKYIMRMNKYKYDVKDVMIPKQGNNFTSELKRARFWVCALPVLSDGIVKMMDERRFECLLLVSDESELVYVVMDAKMRLFKTVVVGELGDGSLKRVVDSTFRWREILQGRLRSKLFQLCASGMTATY